MKIGVSIVLYENTIPEILECLESLKTSAKHLERKVNDLEGAIVLVENSNTSNLSLDVLGQIVDELKAIRIDTQLIQGHGNIGYGAGHNLAISQISLAELDFHLFMNVDVALEESALHQGSLIFQEHPAIAMLSPHAENADGEKQYLCKTEPSVFTLALRGIFPSWSHKFFAERLKKYEARHLNEENLDNKVQIASGCFMYCRASVVAAVGFFDERFFLYFEDFDYSIRMSRAGQIAYAPSLRIKHYGGNASKKGLRHFLYFCRSAFKFFQKYGWKWV